MVISNSAWIPDPYANPSKSWKNLDLIFRVAQEKSKKSSVPSKRISLGAAANWSTPAATSNHGSTASNDLFSINDESPLPQTR